MIKIRIENLLRNTSKSIFPFVLHEMHKYCSESRMRSSFHRWSTAHHAFCWIPRLTCIILSPYEHSATISFSGAVLFVNFIEKLRILVSLKITVARARFHLSSTKKSNWSTESQPVFMVAKKVLSLSRCHHRPSPIQYTWHKRGKFFQFRLMMAACLSFSCKNGKHVHQWTLSLYAISLHVVSYCDLTIFPISSFFE